MLKETSQLILGFRYQLDNRTADLQNSGSFVKQDTMLLGARLRLGKPNLHVSFEGSYLRIDPQGSRTQDAIVSRWRRNSSCRFSTIYGFRSRLVARVGVVQTTGCSSCLRSDWKTEARSTSRKRQNCSAIRCLVHHPHGTGEAWGPRRFHFAKKRQSPRWPSVRWRRTRAGG